MVIDPMVGSFMYFGHMSSFLIVIRQHYSAPVSNSVNGIVCY